MTMKHLPPTFTWLALAALIDWLVTRTLTRAAIFMPKPPAVLLIYQGLTRTGQVATSLTGLLAFLAMGWIAWQQLRSRDNPILAVVWLGLMLTSLLALFIPSGGWLELAFHVLLLTALLMLFWHSLQSTGRPAFKIAVTCTVLALFAGRLFQTLPAAYSALHLPGPPGFSELYFNLGELMVLLSIITLWWCCGRRAPVRIWLVASLPALGLAIPRLLNPAMTGILAIWSTGLTLYLPWPLYAVALWLACVTAIYSLNQGDPVGLALLLLAAGGYASQLSIHAFLGLISIWMLDNVLAPSSKGIRAVCIPKPDAQALTSPLDR